MKKLLFHLMIGAMILCLFPTPSPAETGYVSDMLLLNFRQGPGNTHAVIKTLKSNTPVTILEEENGFYKVELQSKEIGWIDKNFIVFEPPKTQIIDQLQQKNKALENKISQLESTGQTLKDTIKSLEADLKKGGNQPGNHPIRMDPPKNIQELIDKNKQLQKENSRLSKDPDQLNKAQKGLFKSNMIKWFLSGVGVLLLGWIIGQSISSKKQQSRSSLLG
jgi:SH3 domain protein